MSKSYIEYAETSYNLAGLVPARSQFDTTEEWAAVNDVIHAIARIISSAHGTAAAWREIRDAADAVVDLAAERDNDAEESELRERMWRACCRKKGAIAANKTDKEEEVF